MSNETNAAAARYEYGPEARTNRDYESLTDKQRNTVDALVEHDLDATQQEVAAEAGVTASYVSYVEERFPHIINQRRGTTHHEVAADGGARTYQVELTSEQAWKAVRLLPDELSETIFRQVRNP